MAMKNRVLVKPGKPRAAPKPPRIYRTRWWSVRKRPMPHMEVIARRVQRPEDFGAWFRQGQRVFEAHMNAVNARDMFRLLDMFERQMPAWRAKGFVGMVGDTPNEALVRLFRRRFRHCHTFPSPKKAVEETRRRYAYNVEKNGFSADYLYTPVTRIVVPF